MENLLYIHNICRIDKTEEMVEIKSSYIDLSKHNFWWKHPKQWITTTPIISSNIYLDSEYFPVGLIFKITKIKPWDTRTYIDGTFISKERFIKQLNSDV